MYRPINTLLLSGAIVMVAAASVSGQDEQAPSGPAWFSGTSSGQPIVFEPDFAIEPGVWMDARGGEIHGIVWETDDPRVSGDLSYTFHVDEWPVTLGQREELVAIERLTSRLENEAGAWAGNGTLVMHFLTDGDEILDEVREATHVLEGEGAYEGLTAFVTIDFITDSGSPDIRGVILPEPPTEFPAPPTAPESAD